MIEMDRNDPVVNTGRSSEENDLVGSRQRKWPEQDRAEIENEENDCVVGVTDKGAVSVEIHCLRPKFTVYSHSNFSRFIQIPPNEQGKEVAACRHVNASFFVVASYCICLWCMYPYRSFSLFL